MTGQFGGVPSTPSTAAKIGSGFIHTAAAAVGYVISHAVAVGCPMTDVVQPHFDQALLCGALEDATFQIRKQRFGEQAKDIETHDIILAAICTQCKRFRVFFDA